MIKKRLYRKRHIAHSPYLRYTVDSIPWGWSVKWKIRCRLVRIRTQNHRVGMCVDISQKQYRVSNTTYRKTRNKIKHLT